MGPCHDKLDRMERCGVNDLENSTTLGAELANTVPVVPSAQRSGMADRLVLYALQSGLGTASPEHTSCCTPDANPVLSSALPS